VLHKDDGLELKSDWRRNGRAKPVKMDLTLTADVASLADRRERERERGVEVEENEKSGGRMKEQPAHQASQSWPPHCT